MEANAREEHRWLQRLAGEWRYESEGEAGPGEPPVRDHGRESGRRFGDVWVVLEGHSESGQDGNSAYCMTIGFDPDKESFVGTFIGSTMAFLWIYEEGALEADGTRLALYSDGPSFEEEGKTVRYRDTIEMRGDDERVMTSHYQRDDGGWHAFMVSTYRRAGSS